METVEQRVKKIVAEGLTEFRSRDLYRALNAHRTLTAQEFESRLEDLVNMGYLRKIIDSVKPPKYHWMVNPAVHAAD